MKNWGTLAFIIAGLSLALYLQFVEHQASGATEDAVADEAYVQPDLAPVTAEADEPTPTFGGYPCPHDCSENRAGYAWASENNIRDPDNCTGDTGAFIEGCRVYAQEQAASTPRD